MTTDQPPFDQMEQDAAEQRKEVRDTSRIEAEIETALFLEQRIKEAQETIRELTKKLDTIMEVTLPQFMQELGLTEFGIKNGARVRLGPNGSGPGLRGVKDMDEAVAYLESNGFEGGVLTELVMKFTESEREQAAEAADLLHETTHKAVSIKRGINWATLRAWVIRKIDEDPEFDPEKVGFTITTKASFSKRPS